MDMKSLDSMFQTFARGCTDEMYTPFMKVLFEFVDRLLAVFRKYEPQLSDARQKLVLAVDNGNSSDVVHGFMDATGDFKAEILQHDRKVLKQFKTLPLFESIDIDADWTTLSEKAQNALWSYLGKLVVLGSKCLEAEKVLGPLKDDTFRQKLLQTTVECNEEFSKDGAQISSMQDVMNIASRINAKLRMV